MFLFCLVFAMSLCASVYMCLMVTCWERADLLALVCGVYCEFVTFPLVSWVRCGTWLYRFQIFAPLLTLLVGVAVLHSVCSLAVLHIFQSLLSVCSLAWVIFLRQGSCVYTVSHCKNPFRKPFWKFWLREEAIVKIPFQTTMQQKGSESR